MEGHRNPWNGMCIHGKKGAFLYKGSQVNPKCDLCKKDGKDGSS